MKFHILPLFIPFIADTSPFFYVGCSTITPIISSTDSAALSSNSIRVMDYLYSADPFLGFDTSPRPHFEIDYESRKGARDTNRFLSFLESGAGKDAQTALQTASVVGYGSIANWSLVASALSTASNLIQLDWHSNAPISQLLLRRLEDAHPSLKLNYEIPFSNWDLFDPEVPPVQSIGKEPAHEKRALARKSVIGSTILHSVKGEIGYGAVHNPEGLELLHEILTSCPNLKKLDLKVGWAGGCVIGAEQPYGFDFSAGSRFLGKKMVALEEIKLDGYRLHSMLSGYRMPGPKTTYTLKFPLSLLPGWISNWIPPPLLSEWNLRNEVTEENEEVFPTNLDGWLDHMDWNQLHTLEVDSMSRDEIQKLQPGLTSLTNLTVSYASCGADTAWHTLLNESVVPMKAISLRNVDRKNFEDTVVTSNTAFQEMIISRHGQTLLSLTLGESAGFRGRSAWENDTYMTRYAPHVYLTPENLRKLAAGCPNLEQLDIDLNRTSSTTLDSAALDTLPGFLKLTKLTLRIESSQMEDRRRNQQSDEHIPEWRLNHMERRDKILNDTSVLALFHNLRAEQQHRRGGNGVAALVNLSVIVGSGDSARVSYRSRTPSRYAAGSWTCSVDNQQDGREICEGNLLYSSLDGRELDEFDEIEEYDEEIERLQVEWEE